MKLENSKIIFLGDSITEGSGTSSQDNTFHQIISRRHNLSAAYNCGIGGTRIAKQNDFFFHPNHIQDMYFALRVDALPEEADAIVVFGGTNDFGHGDALMGDIDSIDVKTFCGAVNILISNLKEKYPTSKIIFMTPLRRVTEDTPNVNGYILKDYVEKLIQILQKQNIPFIDLFTSEIFDIFDKEIVPDGLHPSDKGHVIMADYIAKELQKI